MALTLTWALLLHVTNLCVINRLTAGTEIVLMETIINLWGAVTKFTNLLLVLEASGGSDPVSAHNKHEPKGQNSHLLSLIYKKITLSTVLFPRHLHIP